MTTFAGLDVSQAKTNAVRRSGRADLTHVVRSG